MYSSRRECDVIIPRTTNSHRLLRLKNTLQHRPGIIPRRLRKKPSLSTRATKRLNNSYRTQRTRRTKRTTSIPRRKTNSLPPGRTVQTRRVITPDTLPVLAIWRSREGRLRGSGRGPAIVIRADIIGTLDGVIDNDLAVVEVSETPGVGAGAAWGCGECCGEGAVVGECPQAVGDGDGGVHGCCCWIFVCLGR